MLDKVFAIILLAAGAIAFLFTQYFRLKMKRLHLAVQEREGKVRSYLQEIMESLLVVKIFDIDEKMIRMADELQEDHFAVQMKRRSFSIAANCGIGFTYRLGQLYALVWGAMGIFHGTMTYGTLTAMIQLISQIQLPITNLSGLMPKTAAMLASADRLMAIEEFPDEAATAHTAVAGDRQIKAIRCRNVEFAYERETVLGNVNLSVQEGDFIAVTGGSGGGKSTLFLLLTGIYQPLSGCVEIETADGIWQPDRSARKFFSYVPQGNYLFSGTIRENICLLNEHAGEEAMKKAAGIACVEAFVRQLPDGYDTLIGEKGAGLSEGQAQRIAIARAILSDAPVLLLDEATSALDEQLEAELLANIAQLKGKICMIVTHRPAALRICKKQWEIKNGRIEATDL